MNTEEMVLWVAEQDEFIPPKGKEAIAICARLREADVLRAKLHEGAEHLRENLVIMKEAQARINQLEERWKKLKHSVEILNPDMTMTLREIYKSMSDLERSES